jgi:hypothetical protein
MGVYLSLMSLSVSKAEELAADYQGLQDFLNQSLDAVSKCVIYRIFGGPEPPPFEWLFVDLDKAWHGLHFLLTGTRYEGDEPVCYLVGKGRRIGDFHGEYEVRWISPSEVANFENALQAIDEQELMRRFDGHAMAQAQIYPTALWERNDEEGRSYVCEKFHALSTFLGEAKSRGEGAIIWHG